MLRIRLSFRIGNAEYAVVNFDDTNIAPQSTSNINRWTENKKKFKWHSISRVDISGDRQNTPRSQNHDGRCKFNFKHTRTTHIAQCIKRKWCANERTNVTAMFFNLYSTKNRKKQNRTKPEKNAAELAAIVRERSLHLRCIPNRVRFLFSFVRCCCCCVIVCGFSNVWKKNRF